MADIAVVGAGTRIPDHMTLEALETLRGCQVVYRIFPPDDEEWLTDFLGVRVVSIFRLYDHSRPRYKNYEESTALILDAARRERPIAYLTRGSPMVFDSVAAGILRGSSEFDVRIVPAISSVEAIMALLGEDYASGLQIMDATNVFVQDLMLLPELTHLLLQPGVFGSVYSSIGREPQTGVLTPLKRHLQRFYPDDHEILFVRIAQRWGEKDHVHRFRLGNLESVGKRELWGTTMVIPRIKTLGTLPKPA